MFFKRKFVIFSLHIFHCIFTYIFFVFHFLRHKEGKNFNFQLLFFLSMIFSKVQMDPRDASGHVSQNMIGFCK